MGDWDNTAYVASSDQVAVLAMVRRLFEESGRKTIGRPVQRTPVFPDPMQYGTGETTPRWAAAVLPGKRWTLVKTAPFELMCEPVDGVPRLAVLARELGCDAFQLNMYDGDSLILVEANAAGDFYISGLDLAKGPVPYHGFEIDETDFEVGFHLIDVPEEVAEALAEPYVADASRRIRDLLHGDAEACSNVVQVEALIPHRVLDGGQVIYAERTASRAARPPFELGLAIDRTANATRYRLGFGSHELWIHDGAGTSMAPRTSADAGPIVAQLAAWLGCTAAPGGERVPAGVQVFGDIDPAGTATISVQANHGNGVLPLGLALDEAGGGARLCEVSPEIADELIATFRDAWLADTGMPCLIPHVEQVPLPPFETADAVAVGDAFAIACGQRTHTTVWRWRPDRAAELVADVPGGLEQLARGPGEHEVTLRVGHGELGHGIDDERDLYAIDVATGERRTVVRRRAYAGAFAWSPDRTRLALAMSRELSPAERRRQEDAVRTGRAPLGASSRYWIELLEPTTGERVARSPDHVELLDPQWIGDTIFCTRVDPTGMPAYATWRPEDDSVVAVTAWRELGPGGLAIGGDHETSWIERDGERVPVAAVRPPPWSEPVAWLDPTTCILGDKLTPTFTVEIGVAVDLRTASVTPVLASRGAMPIAATPDGTVIAARGRFALWWGKRS